MDFLENEFFDYARCQRPDGSIYGTAGVCRKGSPISAKKVGELVKEAKRRGYNDADIKRVAERVREKYGVKILKGDALMSAGRRLGEGDLSPAPDKAAKKPAKKAAPKKKAAKKADEKPAAKKAPAKKANEKPAPKERKRSEAPTKSYAKEEGKKMAKPEEAGLKPGATKGTKGYDPATKWDAKGNKELGEGAFGAVKTTKGPPPGIIKKGDIGEYEMAALQKLKGVEGVPEFHGQNINGPVKEARLNIGGSVATAPGYLAMSKADGTPMVAGMQSGFFRKKPEAAVAAMDEYVRLRRDMHLKGVAHNDMHAGNFFYNPKTAKGSIVDFGLAQISPRAAMFEALGTSGRLTGADFQATRFRNFYDAMIRGKGIQSTRLARFEANQLRAQQRLKELGFNPDKIPEIRTNLRTGRGITRGWENLTDAQANEVLGILYDGV